MLRPGAPTRRTDRGGGSSVAFGQHFGGDEGTTVASGPGAARLTQVDALLALQEVPDPRQGKSRAQRHANDLLDRLDEIRLGLLTGSIPVHRLQALSARLNSDMQATPDPRLAEVMAEIELRCAVELAKLGL